MDEEKLIEQAKQGDLDAFHDLVEAYYPTVERFAYQIGSPPSQIDDVTQEVFLRVYRFLHKYSRGKFSTWLYKITLNISRDIIRKNNRDRKKVKKLSQQPTEGSQWMDKALLKDMEHQYLHQLITNLDEKYRVPLILFYFQERKYQEIADILSVPLSTVKTRITRARGQLKAALEEASEGDNGASK